MQRSGDADMSQIIYPNGNIEIYYGNISHGWKRKSTKTVQGVQYIYVKRTLKYKLRSWLWDLFCKFLLWLDPEESKRMEKHPHDEGVFSE